VLSVACWSADLSQAADKESDGGGDKKAGTLVDCRYESVDTGDDSAEARRPKGLPFPSDDVFRPLFADPKQPQFFATYQAARVRDANTSANIGSVGFGENFGLYARRRGCDGWQVGILAGVFSQFNLDAPSSDLINTDFVFGIPVSWRSGLFSVRARLYHQSSHLGDELLLGNPGLNRVNLSFEEAEALLSLDAPGGWGRIYAGGGYLLHRTPDLERAKAQWGVELRGPTMRPLFLGETVGALRVTPVLGADFKAFEELAWNVNTNAVAGIEWSRATGTRRFRLLFNYYRGFNPYGQFFNQKIETFGIGLYLAF
jgi:hypothetical protein